MMTCGGNSFRAGNNYNNGSYLGPPPIKLSQNPNTGDIYISFNYVNYSLPFITGQNNILSEYSAYVEVKPCGTKYELQYYSKKPFLNVAQSTHNFDYNFPANWEKSGKGKRGFFTIFRKSKEPYRFRKLLYDIQLSRPAINAFTLHIIQFSDICELAPRNFLGNQFWPKIKTAYVDWPHDSPLTSTIRVTYVKKYGSSGGRELNTGIYASNRIRVSSNSAVITIINNV